MKGYRPLAQNKKHLKLGKGSAFVKTRLKQLRQEDETWEADFRALPKPLAETATHYLGMVVTAPHGFFLADETIDVRPTVNDLATLLAHAMRRPLAGKSHRPSRILVRGHRQWQELFPHLAEVGIDVVVQSDLPQIEDAYQDYLQQVWNKQRKDTVMPPAEQVAVEELFPAVAKWVRGYGHIEIGDQETFGFVARALDYGGMVFEHEKAKTLAEAMAALEKALAAWFQENE